MSPPRLLPLLAALSLAACSGPSGLSDTLFQARTPRSLDPGETRAVARAWEASNFSASLDGHPITIHNKHPALPQVTAFIDPARIRTRLPLQPGSIGLPVLANSGPPRKISKRLSSHAHQITLQPATLLATQTGPSALELSLYDPRSTPSLDGSFLARADGLLIDQLQRSQPQSFLNLRALFSPAAYAGDRGLYLLTPYDREKIPVIFLHGLASSPFAYRDMLTRLERDPALWHRYQFWFYFYPTGEPWVASASAFRRDLSELLATLDPDRNDRRLHDMVLVAHSMGGLIARASVSHNSTALWQAYFNRNLEDLRVTPAQKNRLRELLLYPPIPWPSRIVFLATPHHGSRLAEGPVEWVARQIIRVPARVIGGTILTTELLAFGEPGILTTEAYQLLRNGEVSITQLDPASPSILALQRMPMRREVRYHSIIGDLAGSKTRLGTDGVVPYESAHLPGAESERIVHAVHALTGDPETIEEVARILRVHLAR